jgi:diguanylate cyclase (GGDEF)-like protein
MNMSDSRGTKREMNSGALSVESEMFDTGQIDITPTARKLIQSAEGGKKACLIVLRGQDVGQVTVIGDESTIIGRDAECAMVMQEEGISRQHASVRMGASGNIIVTDLGSTNGTYLEGKKITEANMKPGDKVFLGRHTVLKMMMQDELDMLYQQEMYDSSIRDGLTGVHNRRYLDDRLGKDLSYARRHRIPFSFIMFDLDNFKKVNDAHGHQSGDRVLVEVSNMVTGIIRAEDVFCRYGGEEFAVMTSSVDQTGGRTLGERICHGVSSANVRAQDGSGKLIRVTVSVGVATVQPRAVVNSEAVIAAADANLYQAKKNGRNQVVATIIE